MARASGPRTGLFHGQPLTVGSFHLSVGRFFSHNPSTSHGSERTDSTSVALSVFGRGRTVERRRLVPWLRPDVWDEAWAPMAVFVRRERVRARFARSPFSAQDHARKLSPSLRLSKAMATSFLAQTNFEGHGPIPSQCGGRGALLCSVHVPK